MSKIIKDNQNKFIPNNKYKYNPMKEAKKYCRLTDLYNILPQLRKDIHDTLNNFDYSKNHIIYLIIALIDLCNFRIGNEKYTKSTGTATLKVNQVTDCSTNKNSCSAISFIGKRGVLNQCEVLNDKVNNILMNMTEYKDDDDFIFTYRDFNGLEHKITAQDVNELLHQYGNITTKMFRTWKANYYFVKNIKKFAIPQNQTQTKKNISKAVEITAEKLHHTKAICRRSYIDSRLINQYKEAPLNFFPDRLEEEINPNPNPYLLHDEEDLIELLREQC